MQSSLPMVPDSPSLLPLGAAPDALFGTPLQHVLFVVVALAVIVFVGRVLLKVAWKLLVLAAVVVGVLYVLSVLGV